ncbi:hypothetical protein CK203_070364 [Vitis vinifera]|uniref:Uncharacterized protein n=1 Tax=Vitis vinifera TaxID=29760 RepID=A0A438E6N7_VITVI|nr:hypothetical protein CK203_070364 [Vitis vinifera]
MASLQFLLRPSSPPDLDRFDVPTNARRCLTALLLFTIMYAFTLITISRHILLEFGAAPDMEKNGGIMERGQEGRQCVGFVLWKWGFGISTIRKSWV